MKYIYEDILFVTSWQWRHCSMFFDPFITDPRKGCQAEHHNMNYMRVMQSWSYCRFSSDVIIFKHL